MSQPIITPENAGREMTLAGLDVVRTYQARLASKCPVERAALLVRERAASARCNEASAVMKAGPALVQQVAA